MAKHCTRECLDGEAECCICCDKLGECCSPCEDMDSYEFAEDCPEYVTDVENCTRSTILRMTKRILMGL